MASDPPERKPAKPSQSLFGSSMTEAAPYLGLGIEILISMLLFVLLGYFADAWLGTSPWLLLVGIVLSAVATGATLYKTVRELDAANRKGGGKERKSGSEDEG
ncbi:MAG: AtpZ/AtpI family protein [Bacteroidota bacterium]